MGILNKKKITVDLTKGQEQFFDDKAIKTPLFREMTNCFLDKGGRITKALGFSKISPRYGGPITSAFTEVNDVIDDDGVLTLVDSQLAFCKQNPDNNYFDEGYYKNISYEIDPSTIVKVGSASNPLFSELFNYMLMNDLGYVITVYNEATQGEDYLSTITIRDQADNIIYNRRLKSSYWVTATSFSGGFYFAAYTSAYKVAVANGSVLETKYTYAPSIPGFNEYITDALTTKKYYYDAGAIYQSNLDNSGAVSKYATPVLQALIAERKFTYSGKEYLVLMFAATAPSTSASVVVYNLTDETGITRSITLAGACDIYGHISNQKAFNSNIVTLSYSHSAHYTQHFEYNFTANTIAATSISNGVYVKAFYTNNELFIVYGSGFTQFDFSIDKQGNSCFHNASGASLDIQYSHKKNKLYALFYTASSQYIAEIKQNKQFDNKPHRNYIIEKETGRTLAQFGAVKANTLGEMGITSTAAPVGAGFPASKTYNVTFVVRYKDTILYVPVSTATVGISGSGATEIQITIKQHFGIFDYYFSEDCYLEIDFYIKENSDAQYFFHSTKILENDALITYSLTYYYSYRNNKLLDNSLSTQTQCFSFIKQLGLRYFCGYGSRIAYSTLTPEKLTPNFKSGYRYEILHPLGINWIQIDKIDEKLVLFAEDGIYASVGDGFFDDGTGTNYSMPQKISDYVIKNKYSAVKINDGMLIVCNNGNYILDRGLQCTLLTGVYEYGANPITAYDSCFNPSLEQVTFFCANYLYVFDCKTRSFYKDSIQLKRGACVDGKVIGCTTGDNYYYKQGYSYVNGDIPKVVSLESTWIKCSDISGFGRLYKIIFHLNSLTRHGYTVKILYDYNEDLNDAEIHNFTQTIDEDDFIFEVYSDKQKCESFKFYFEEQSNSMLVGDNHSLKIYGIDFIIGSKQTENKLSVSERA